MPNAAPVVIRPPQQARSSAALARIFKAAQQLLETASFDQIRVNDIAAEADVSVGSIYQRFKKKDDLLWALYDAYLTETERQFEKLVAESHRSSLSMRVADLIELISSLFRERRGIVRSLLIKYRHNTNDIPPTFVARIGVVYDTGVKLLAQAPNSNHSAEDAQFAFSLIMSFMREEILFGDTRRLMPDEKISPRFEKLLHKAVMGALK